MNDLIKALQIFRRYTDTDWPTGCDHDVMYVYVDPEDVSQEDTEELIKLSFLSDDDLGCFYSFRFGSA